jgi:hypothetical protein
MVVGSASLFAQSIRIPWVGYARNPQHDAVSVVASQPLSRILWQTPVDFDPGNGWGDINIHYGSPLITRSNTIIVPVKTGYEGGFEMQAQTATNGALLWTLPSDYVAPAHNWFPSFSGTLTPKNRLYFPGAGGTVWYCDTPDTTNPTPPTGQIAFYGLTNYLADSNTWQSNVFIDTPITSDRYGDIYFGFAVVGTNSLNLTGGLAKIDFNGNGSWISAAGMAGDDSMVKVAMNCAPALSLDHRSVYVAVNDAPPSDSVIASSGYLVSLDALTLAPLNAVRLMDYQYPENDADVTDDSTSSPTVGPDGDVFYGVVEIPRYSNHNRGWLLHFDATLSTNKMTGAFGWDDTAAIVPTNMVPSYSGTSPYLIMTKYNNYADPGIGGDGVNKIAILDPDDCELDPVTGIMVMNEVLTITGPTPDPDLRDALHPNAVREWCINTAAIDPFTKSVMANNEDGNLYRWDLVSNTLSETNTLTAGQGEAYTPTLIGLDGIVYAINGGNLFAVGH